jgi:hypothetical protein
VFKLQINRPASKKMVRHGTDLTDPTVAVGQAEGQASQRFSSPPLLVFLRKQALQLSGRAHLLLGRRAQEVPHSSFSTVLTFFIEE